MKNTLEDLYYGSIIPCDTRQIPGSALEKALRRAAECEENLTHRLAGTEKMLLLELIDAHDEITGTMALKKFILGFRLGMRLAVEGLAEDEVHNSTTQSDCRKKGVNEHGQTPRQR